MSNKARMERERQTVWHKWQCEHGAQWTTTREGEHAENDECYFSGCQPDHRMHYKGSTTNADEASGWFQRPGAITGHYRALIAFPDLHGQIPCFGERIHATLGFQVRVKSFGEMAWINIPREQYTPRAMKGTTK